MISSNIKSFSIYGLFGANDVHIPFDDNIKILIGENGLGKTQALNIFYYTLTTNFFRLSEFNFTKIELKFLNISPIEITKKSIDELVKKTYKHPIVKDLIDELGFSQFEILRNKFIANKGDWHSLEEQYRLSDRFNRKVSIHRIFRVFEELDMLETKSASSFLGNIQEKINHEIRNSKIMYFPTFRRVEEDLHNLGYNEDELLDQEETLIQFGMNDVLLKFKQIEHKIDRLLKEGFSKISSEIVSQLVKGFSKIDNSCLDKIDEDDIEIILSRIGNQLSEEEKTAMRDIVVNKNFKNPSLVYFLKKLIEIYEKQKELDNSVKKFRDVCNKYLIDKEVFYDESAIKIFIKSTITNKEILLEQLSSGEKQIISMFSKIYLSSVNAKFIMLFDEPELSLSMTWQKQLLPDIIHSKKCDFLLAVTHSPFIFDNELDQYAIGLNEYIKNSEVIV